MKGNFGMNNKLFDSKRIAEGYKERPFLHKYVIDALQRDMNGKHFHNGLDVGCGAGLSTKALKLICDKVSGTDISEEMVLVAREMCPEEEYTFFVSKAETIPNPEQLYDIVTAAGVVQWVEVGTFLDNLRSIISKDGIAFIYDFWISDKMKENAQYTDWYYQEYLKNFPKPPRNEHIWTDEIVSPYGFEMQRQNILQLEYKFNKETFIKFMMLQSNVSIKIEGEGQNEKEIKTWFEDSLRNIFDSQEKVLFFDGYSWLLKRKFT